MLWRRRHRGFDPLHRRYTCPDQPRGLEDAGALQELGANLLDFGRASGCRPIGLQLLVLPSHKLRDRVFTIADNRKM
jgi:hypothetical protein